MVKKSKIKSIQFTESYARNGKLEENKKSGAIERSRNSLIVKQSLDKLMVEGIQTNIKKYNGNMDRYSKESPIKKII